MGYVTIPTNLLTNPVFNLHFSELIRLYILYEMGGVWIDPNVLLTAPTYELVMVEKSLSKFLETAPSKVSL